MGDPPDKGPDEKDGQKSLPRFQSFRPPGSAGTDVVGRVPTGLHAPLRTDQPPTPERVPRRKIQSRPDSKRIIGSEPPPPPRAPEADEAPAAHVENEVDDPLSEDIDVSVTEEVAEDVAEVIIPKAAPTGVELPDSLAALDTPSSPPVAMLDLDAAIAAKRKKSEQPPAQRQAQPDVQQARGTLDPTERLPAEEAPNLANNDRLWILGGLLAAAVIIGSVLALTRNGGEQLAQGSAETGSETESESETGSETGSETETGTESESESATETETGSETETADWEAGDGIHGPVAELPEPRAEVLRENPWVRRNRAADLRREARRHYMNGRLSSAHREFEHSLEWDPSSADAMRYLSRTLQREDEMDLALAWARRVIATEPDNPRNHELLGDQLLMLGRTAEAEAAYRAGIAKAPGDVRLRSRVRRLGRHQYPEP